MLENYQKSLILASEASYGYSLLILLSQYYTKLLPGNFALKIRVFRGFSCTVKREGRGNWGVTPPFVRIRTKDKSHFQDVFSDSDITAQDIIFENAKIRPQRTKEHTKKGENEGLYNGNQKEKVVLYAVLLLRSVVLLLLL